MDEGRDSRVIFVRSGIGSPPCWLRWGPVLTLGKISRAIMALHPDILKRMATIEDWSAGRDLAFIIAPPLPGETPCKLPVVVTAGAGSLSPDDCAALETRLQASVILIDPTSGLGQDLARRAQTSKLRLRNVTAIQPDA